MLTGPSRLPGQRRFCLPASMRPTGIAVDRHDNLWVVANQEDEIDPNGITTQGALAKVLAKRGDFEGLSQNGTVQGLLFPARPAFGLDGKTLYIFELVIIPPKCRGASDGDRPALDTRGQALHDSCDS